MADRERHGSNNAGSGTPPPPPLSSSSAKSTCQTRLPSGSISTTRRRNLRRRHPRPRPDIPRRLRRPEAVVCPARGPRRRGNPPPLLVEFRQTFGPAQVARRGLVPPSGIFSAVFMRHVDGLLVSTSPPMGPLAALAIAAVRRLPIVYWAMDINPDQAVALGRFRAHSKPVRWMDRLNRTILRRARKVITLDRFMAERLQRKQDCGPRLAVIPPWPLDDGFQPIDHQHNSFRHQHRLEHKFVAMYHGNMSIAHPLRTLLHAARRLRDCTDLVFLFVGGGLGRKEVERFVAEDDAGNIRILPYQPREQLRYSLSAADIHLVSMGDDMVGIVHPCKIYGAMACGRPVLFVGPRVSHAAELIAKHRIGWQVEHGNVDGVVAAVREAMNAPETMLAEMGCRATDRNLSPLEQVVDAQSSLRRD